MPLKPQMGIKICIGINQDLWTSFYTNGHPQGTESFIRKNVHRISLARYSVTKMTKPLNISNILKFIQIRLKIEEHYKFRNYYWNWNCQYYSKFLLNKNLFLCLKLLFIILIASSIFISCSKLREDFKKKNKRHTKWHWPFLC